MTFRRLMMRPIGVVVGLAVGLVIVAGCDDAPVDREPSQPSVVAPSTVPEGVRPTSALGQSLAEARRGFKSTLVRRAVENAPPETPPAGVFQLVKYQAPPGELSAYLTPDPGDGERHPAIVWITGGDCNSIGDVWSDAPVENDQTARAFREAGIVMMFPSLRGGNDNPGQREGFLGEVDDVIAAAQYLAQQPYVDPKRIYLGGHSTGGTLALLVAASTDKFRAVFAFGPADNVASYPDEFLPFDTSNGRELELRSPLRWVGTCQCPTFVIEGTVEANTAALELMRRATANPLVHFHTVPGGDHFSILTPMTRALAAKVKADTGPRCDISLDE